MAKFDAYLNTLSDALRSQSNTGAYAALLFGANDAVRESYDLSFRRSHGIFFTTRPVASRIASLLQYELLKGGSLFDPAMGAGDLFIAGAMSMPRGRNVRSTLRRWSDLLYGFDSHAKFIGAAKLRLALAAKLLHNSSEQLDIDEVYTLFPHFACADFLSSDISNLPDGICVITNPPFATVKPRPSSMFQRLTVSAAALFLEKLCKEAPSRAQIAGIFPEVLRCGSSYRDLRESMTHYFAVVSEQSLNRREMWRNVDVDVFLAHYEKIPASKILGRQFPERRSEGRRALKSHKKRVDEKFWLTVGPVIPYRTPQRGPWRRYITARTVPAWGLGFRPTVSRRYKGVVAKPPFVVVRRTSRPDRRFRAVASVVIGELEVAVENHLIILRPKDGLLTTCRRLVKALQDANVNAQLDQAMRCRHLTVGSLASVEVII